MTPHLTWAFRKTLVMLYVTFVREPFDLVWNPDKKSRMPLLVCFRRETIWLMNLRWSRRYELCNLDHLVFFLFFTLFSYYSWGHNCPFFWGFTFALTYPSCLC